MPRKTALIPTLPDLTDTAALGPAMRALSPRQCAFVAGKVFYGLGNVDACRAAGYAESVALTNAHVVAQHEGVQAAIEEETRKLMKSEGPKSVLTLVEIRDTKTNKAADRIKASVELLNRAGLHAVTEHHEYQHLSEAETDRRILALAAELGLSKEQAKLMLVQPDDFEKNAEGVYQLVEPAPRTLSDDPKAVAKRATRARRRGMTAAEIADDMAQVETARVETLRRERAEHEARRAADLETDPFADVEY